MSMTDSLGLSEAAAAERFAAEGPNELPSPAGPGLVKLFGRSLREPMLQLLLAAGLIYLAIGEPLEGGLMFASGLLAVTIATVQDFRSESALAALRTLAAPRALVIREGVRRRIPAREVVSGDLIALQEGDRVPADAHMHSGAALVVDESLLTGESLAVSKHGGGPGESGLALAGTLVLAGEGLATVSATGARSAMGRIGASLAGAVMEKPRLQRQMGRLVRNAGIAGALACLTLAALLMAAGRGLLESVLSALALAIAMVPEEIPLVIAVFTVMGALRISRAGVLARRASAIETLGETTVLCVDKTGTLTWNRMGTADVWTAQAGLQTAQQAVTGRDASVERLFGCALAAAVTSVDPMETAIADFAGRLGIEPPGGAERVASYGFDRRALASGTLWRAGGDCLRLALKGAPETLVAACDLSPGARDMAASAAASMAMGGRRVIAVAEADAAPDEGDLLSGPLRLVGLIGLADPLRESVPAAVAECRRAGVRVVMITGDRPETAVAIAAQAGIEVSGGATLGDELLTLDEAELIARVRVCDVFARVKPEQKLALVRALKAAGEVVAMTGDGVNDAPALAAADIGVAMGARGSDVAREAAALVLLNDDLPAMVATMRLGRRIADNIGKAVRYVLSIHALIVMAALTPLLLGMPPLLLPLHVVMLEFVIDPACSVVLEAEPEDSEVMRRPPRSALQGVVDRASVLWSLATGAAASLGVVGAFIWVFDRGGVIEDARATAFVVLLAANLGLIELSRRRMALRAAGQNRLVWALALVVAAVGAAILWVPPLGRVFDIGVVDWSAALAFWTAGMGLGWLVSLLSNQGPGVRRVAADRPGLDPSQRHQPRPPSG
jgi:Ca2+-transporting ATPase